MVQTIIAVDPNTRNRRLLVEVYPELLSAEKLQETIAAFERRLFDRNIYSGLIVTPEVFVVVYDKVTDLSFKANRFDVRRLPAAELFKHASLGEPRQGEGLALQARKWLEAVGTSWFSYLWPGAVKAMVPDVIGYVAQAELEEIDGLVDQDDAA